MTDCSDWLRNPWVKPPPPCSKGKWRLILAPSFDWIDTLFHRKNAGTLGMVPLIINPILIYTLYSGYLLGISLKGSNRAVKQLGYHPRVAMVNPKESSHIACARILIETYRFTKSTFFWVGNLNHPKLETFILIVHLPSPQAKSSPLKIGHPKRTFHLPTIHFQGQTRCLFQGV